MQIADMEAVDMRSGIQNLRDKFIFIISKDQNI